MADGVVYSGKDAGFLQGCFLFPLHWRGKFRERERERERGEEREGRPVGLVGRVPVLSWKLLPADESI